MKWTEKTGVGEHFQFVSLALYDIEFIIRQWHQRKKHYRLVPPMNMSENVLSKILIKKSMYPNNCKPKSPEHTFLFSKINQCGLYTKKNVTITNSIIYLMKLTCL